MSTTRACVICTRPLDAADDLVCFKDSNRILRHLRELEEYLPTLSLEKKSPGGGEPIGRAGFGPRSPANDAVLVHTDPRSRASAYDPVADRWTMTCGCPPMDLKCSHSQELGALDVVTSWARVVEEERGVQPAPSAFLSISLLRTHHSWITRQPWVDEYARELRQVHAAVRALAHDPVPKSQGKCIRFEGNTECRGDVYELDDASGVRCSKDKRHVYTGLEMVRLRAAWEVG